MIIGLFFIGSCAKERSAKTGWEFNNSTQGGFEKFPAMDQETGPGLILIEGGTFTMGMTEEDVLKEWNNTPRRITVPSFYMDQTEVSNFDYLEYLYWLKRVYATSRVGSRDNTVSYIKDGEKEVADLELLKEEFDEDLEEIKEGDDETANAFGKFYNNYEESFTANYQEVFRKALPDTLCWRDPLSAMEHYVEYYLRLPAYRDYPVVGVSWVQANEYCKWRTNRVNEFILYREGILDWEMSSKELNPFHMFDTDAYLAGQYFGVNPAPREKNRAYGEEMDEEDEEKEDVLGDAKFNKKSSEDNGRRLRNYNPSLQSINKNNRNYGARIVRLEDGILLPNYRLPTEAEWEYAATGLIGNLQENSENYTDRRIYPWNGHWVRREEDQFQGAIQANFQRGHGDYMGIAGNLNDGAAPTAPVESYWPNDFGLYHMAGNVSEWVQDVYRPNSLDDVADFSPFRGNVYKTKLTTSLGTHDAMKNDRIRYDVHGMREYTNEFERVRYQRIKAGIHDPGLQISHSKNSTVGHIALKYKYDSIVGVSGKGGASGPGEYYPIIDSLGDETVGGKVQDQYLNLITYSIKSGDQNIFSIDTTGVVTYSKLATPGAYTVVVTVDEQGATKIKTSDFNLYFNILAKNQPTGFSNNSNGQHKLISSRNASQFRKGYKPDPLYISSGENLTKEGTQYRSEIVFLNAVNQVLDSAIEAKNNLRTTECSRIIQNELWDGVFNVRFLDKIFSPVVGTSYLEDPAITNLVTMLRNGLSEYITEFEGQMRYREVLVEENIGRLNYRKDDYIDYLDGDIESSIFYNNKNNRKSEINEGKRDSKLVMYQNEHERYDLKGKDLTERFDKGWPTTLVSDKSRVYKGGSWEDRAYWMGAGTRRFLDQRQSTRNIGFRCAMDRVGSPTGKNYGKKKKRKS